MSAPTIAPDRIVEDAPATTTVSFDFMEPEKYAHIVKRGDAVEGYVAGAVVEALCGHRFVPKDREPEKKPLCQGCKNIFEDNEARSMVAGWRGKND